MKLNQLRVLATVMVLGAIGLVIAVQGSGAAPTRHSAATIPPQAALDWNVIAVDTVRAAVPAKFPAEAAITWRTYKQLSTTP
jgi:hypothetical protein